MCKKYFIGIKPGSGGYHMIHHEECPFVPEKHKRIFLGNFISSHDAEAAGTKFFQNSRKCPFCLKGHIKARNGMEDNFLNITGRAVSFKQVTPTWESAMMCGVN